jgi:hypothetical protein
MRIFLLPVRIFKAIGVKFQNWLIKIPKNAKNVGNQSKIMLMIKAKKVQMRMRMDLNGQRW